MSHATQDAAPQVDANDLIRTAQEAGDLILSMQARGLQNIGVKSSSIDLVTEADVAAENHIRQSLRDRYPTIDLWGEESNEPPQSEYYWVVDPIDGTINFANGLGYFAVNIALNHRTETLIGVTLELPSRTLFVARAGEGALRLDPDGRERTVRVNQVSELNAALLATGFPYHRGEHEDNNLAEFNYFITKSQGVRTMGAAALDLINVAQGALAGYWEGWLNAWDAAPGALIVREAGGQVTDYLGKPWDVTSDTLVAGNGQPALHQALLDGIRQARQQLHTRLLHADA